MDDKFATELLHEVKAQTKRWFIAFCVMVGLEIATIAGFMWYISLPVDEVTTTTDQTIEDVDSGNITQIGGDSIGESETDSN